MKQLASPPAGCLTVHLWFIDWSDGCGRSSLLPQKRLQQNSSCRRGRGARPSHIAAMGLVYGLAVRRRPPGRQRAMARAAALSLAAPTHSHATITPGAGRWTPPAVGFVPGYTPGCITALGSPPRGGGSEAQADVALLLCQAPELRLAVGLLHSQR